MDSVHYSSKSNNWQTPKALFNFWNNLYHFDLDLAASKENTLCQNYYCEKLDALKQDWIKDGKVGFLNSPYGQIIGKFIKKAYEEALKGFTTVYLMPSRTDVKAWHDYVMKASEIHFIKGRIKFINPSLPSYRADGNFKSSPAPFPSAIVVFNPHTMSDKPPQIFTFDQKVLN